MFVVLLDDIKCWVEIGGLALVKVLEVKWSHRFSNKPLNQAGSDPLKQLSATHHLKSNVIRCYGPAEVLRENRGWFSLVDDVGSFVLHDQEAAAIPTQRYGC